MSRQLDDVLLTLALTASSTNQPVGLLVRHAERWPIADLARHHEVLLTDEGIAAARASGRRLAQRIRDTGVDPGTIALVHSPVERCGQTARALGEGLVEAGIAVEVIGVVDSLGANYLRDPARVAEEATKRGPVFVRDWFDGVFGDTVIAPCAEVAGGLVEVFAGLLGQHRFVIGVSHDWNIAAVREHMLGLRYEDVGWPPFLDGVVVTLDAAGKGAVRCVHAESRAA
ncbi:MAG TPA: histidine phosphatase family protein [Myxococcota bacterium]